MEALNAHHTESHYDANGQRIASVRSRPQSRRISALELEQLMQRQGEVCFLCAHFLLYAFMQLLSDAIVNTVAQCIRATTGLFAHAANV